MHRDITLITRDFKTEILCYYKETNGGVYDVYVASKCIGVSLSYKELNTLKQVLNCTEKQ